MKLTTTRVDVWWTEIDDTPGGLARTLRAIADYGADLDYVMAHRLPEKPGRGLLYVAPTNHHIQLDRMLDMDVRRDRQRSLLKIEGHDEPGLGARLARVVADAGVSMQAFSTGVVAHRFAAFIEFDSAMDRDRAETAIRAMQPHATWAFWHRTAPKAA